MKIYSEIYHKVTQPQIYGNFRKIFIKVLSQGRNIIESREYLKIKWKNSTYQNYTIQRGKFLVSNFQFVKGEKSSIISIDYSLQLHWKPNPKNITCKNFIVYVVLNDEIQVIPLKSMTISEVYYYQFKLIAFNILLKALASITKQTKI